MTPEERADRVMAQVCASHAQSKRWNADYDLTLYHIREARTEALEEAAKVAEHVTDTTRLKTNVVVLGRDIAAAIRALK